MRHGGEIKADCAKTEGLSDASGRREKTQLSLRVRVRPARCRGSHGSMWDSKEGTALPGRKGASYTHTDIKKQGGWFSLPWSEGGQECRKGK